MKTKSTLIALIMGLTLAITYSFKNNNTVDDPKGLGKVMVIEGKYVFTNAVPNAAYETAFQFETKVHSFGGCPSIKDYAESSVKSAMKKGFPFDAVILGDTKYDLAIKFK